MVFGVLGRLTGVDLLSDLKVFFRALGGLFDGFSERASAVKALLADPATTFLIVTSPEREPVEEAIFFRGSSRAGMPFGGLVVNRVHRWPTRTPAPATRTRSPASTPRWPRRSRRTLAEVRALAARDAAAIERLRAAVGDDDPVVVPHLAGDVHDSTAWSRSTRHLFATGAERARLLSEAAF